MIPRALKPIFWLVALFLVVSLACLGPATQTPPPAVETEGPVEPGKTEEPVPASGAISSLKDVQKAVIQIESQGTFVDPQFGLVQNGAGRGSGFIIDPSGLAITNNHVVTGAGLLKIWIGGDTSKEYNAKILGVSECSDLALIDIDGEGFPYLAWFEDPIEVGTQMYIAGFPLGDPEYTLTQGIISKAKANGVTPYSAIESVVEYDATSNPGNSGGPVVDGNGKVIAVHYWGDREARQARGISRDEVFKVLDDLKAGENVDTIGVNGQAVGTEDGSITGVWVSSVQSGSPADRAGLTGGDIILELENLSLATDGTMGQYCDILRSHTPDDTMNVQVLRWATSELLEGQLNGRELAVVAAFGQDTTGGDTTGTETTGGDTTEGPPGVTMNVNASQPGEIIYSTEFDSVEDWVYLLVLGDESGFTQEASGGKFRTEITNEKTYVYYINEAFTYTNVRLDTRVENLGANTNYIGLFCRYSEDDNSWYEANILNNGEYWIYLVDNYDYHILFSGASTLINMGKDVNEYTFICDGDNLTLGINGNEVKTLSTKSSAFRTLNEGQVGIFVSSEDVVPVIVEFDWFTASVPN